MPGEKRYEEIPFLDELFPIRILWNFQVNKNKVLTEDSIETWHEQLEILYILEGKVQLDCGYQRYICDRGDIVIINPCEEHFVGYLSGEPSYHCIMIDPKLYEGSTLDLCGLKYMLPVNGRKLRFKNLIRDNERVTGILKELLMECEQQKYAFEVAVKGNLLCLFAELFRNELSAHGKDEKVIAGKDNYELIAPVFSYIAENYSRKITLSELARLCCVNSSHLCRIFKKITGKTLVEYINEYRLSKVQLLLLTTDMNISEVAAQAGYADERYMMRRFKASYGFSPGEFRNAARTDDKE